MKKTDFTKQIKNEAALYGITDALVTTIKNVIYVFGTDRETRTVFQGYIESKTNTPYSNKNLNIILNRFREGTIYNIYS